MSIREDIERPLTAYEELKAWCEKHLDADDYKVVPESPSFAQAIYFTENGVGFVCFNGDGSVCGCGECGQDGMEEHLFDLATYEENKDAPAPPTYSPPPTSIGGQMVRKMIEFYERAQR
jgi:hypothetical protein